VKRSDLEHIIRAAGTIADTTQLVIIGSQAILGSFTDAPRELTGSQEVDTYPLEAPERADLIDGSIGEKSPFHETFGYYAHGVGPETAVLPADWRKRTVPVCNDNTRGVTGLCLSPADLAVSKLAAGREKDFQFVTALLRHRLVRAEEVQRLLGELDDTRRELIQHRLDRCQTESARSI
jgi:hypothetical protein